MSLPAIIVAAVCAAALSIACGGSGGGGGGPGPCEGSDPAVGCGIECSGDSGCTTGLHCTDGTCTAECTLGGRECGANQVCDGRGRCIADGGDPGDDDGLPDANCPDVVVEASQVIPAVELIIDWSLSMDADFGTGNRAEATRAALTGSAGVVTRLQDRVIFGATVYSSRNGSDNGATCPLLTNVDRDFNSARAIDAKLDLRTNPLIDDTPTAESIDAVIRDFAANPPPDGSSPVIVLATDGEPDTCVDPDDHTTGPRNSVAAAQRASAAGIPLYILSVGSEVSVNHLQQMANAGLGLPPTGTTKAPFFVANNPIELSQKLEQIIGNIRSCDITLDAALDAADAAAGTVSLGGRDLELGTDWEQVNPTTIRLLGAACDQLLASSAEVTAVFPCGTVVD